MNVCDILKWCLITTLVGLVANISLSNATAASQDQAAAERGVQVLTRGPVHEAFAETVTFEPQPGVVAPKTPPADIEELPPDQKPEGDDVAWIPGYWAWDDERNDFLWVSGVWRALPPGRQWVPGYWGQTSQGYQWTSGYWADATVEEVDYLSEPPATLEVGPSTSAPSANSTWLPGCWRWHQSRYVWRPGYWATGHPNWIWVPDRYVWAPRGYVFVNGYWDYTIARRGMLFAPVYFDRGIYGRPGFSYSPNTAINLAAFVTHLFLRPRYQHYYFGDYYASNYLGAGYMPWFSFNSSRYGYDPIYAHYRWHHRQDREWEQRIAADFQTRRDHENQRPPRTWADQLALSTAGVQAGQESLLIGTSLSQLVESRRDDRQRFQAVDEGERQRLGQRGREIQKLREQRQELEIRAAAPQEPSGQVAPSKVRLPKSSIVARPVDQLGEDRAPPRIDEAPQPDPKVEPKPRRDRTTPPASPGVEQPKPGMTPKAERPGAKVQPKVEQPDPKVQPQPKVGQPKRQPQPKVGQPERQPMPQPKAGQPERQPQRKAGQPERQPLPQPRTERPAPERQPQPRAERPAPERQPRPNQAPRSDGGGGQKKGKAPN